jgi:hypothetical protein
MHGCWLAHTRPEVMDVFQWLRMQAILPMYCVNMKSNHFGTMAIVDLFGVIMPNISQPKYLVILFLSPNCSFVARVCFTSDNTDTSGFNLCIMESYMGGVHTGPDVSAERHADIQKRASVHNAFKDALVHVLRVPCGTMTVCWQPEDELVPGTDALLIMLHMDAVVYDTGAPTKQNVYAVKCMLGVQYFNSAGLLNLQLHEQNTLDTFNRIVKAPTSAVVLKRLGLHNLQ